MTMIDKRYIYYVYHNKYTTQIAQKEKTNIMPFSNSRPTYIVLSYKLYISHQYKHVIMRS